MTKTSQSESSSESRWLFRSMAIGWAIVVAVLLINIVSSPSDLGSPVTESQAIIRANERLLEMVKWTISTILLVGGGLIGLNWYQNERRIKDDLSAFDDKIDEQQKTVIELALSQSASLDFITQRIQESEKSIYLLRSDLQQSTLSLYGFGPEKRYGETLLEMLDKNPGYPNFVIEHVESFAAFVSSQDPQRPFSRYLAADHLEPIAAHMDIAGQTDLANQLRDTHDRIRRHDPPTME